MFKPHWHRLLAPHGGRADELTNSKLSAKEVRPNLQQDKLVITSGVVAHTSACYCLSCSLMTLH